LCLDMWYKCQNSLLICKWLTGFVYTEIFFFYYAPLRQRRAYCFAPFALGLSWIRNFSNQFDSYKNLDFRIISIRLLGIDYHTPRNEVRGVYWNQSVCLSVCPSICPSICLSVSRHKFVPPTPTRFMHGFWWNFAHMLYMIWSCVFRNAIMFCYFFPEVWPLTLVNGK
jgi:hypothetical protein